MLFDFINPAMLIGLAGLSLPIIAHLLSKRKYDVVDWGAMQFLELGKNARRRFRLEELLLLLLRMLLIALLVFALSRPWGAGGFLSRWGAKQSRDVVIVIDGSYSMGWEGKSVTPHAAAIQWVHQFLEELSSGDTVALLDAHDQVRPVIESPTRDFSFVRDALNKLPAPAGSSNIAEAAAHGLQILSRTSNLSRELIILTDGQTRGWSADDANLWTRFDDLKQQPSITPRVFVVNVNDQQTAERVNFSVDRLVLSRELTVANFPVRIKTKIHYSGGSTPTNRRAHLEIDGQRIAEKSVTVQLQPQGDASLDFEYRFSSIGPHLISVVLDDDNLAGDNRADAAVSVAEALPVLLVDGDLSADVALSETFFAKAALSAGSNDTPWVQATVVGSDGLTSAALNTVEVAVLANVARLTDVQIGVLKDFVRRGGGLFVTLGDLIDAAEYNRGLYDSGRGLLPGSLESIAVDADDALQGVRVVESSLELPWIAGFRTANGGTLVDARFSQWWRIGTNLPKAGKNGTGKNGGETTATQNTLDDPPDKNTGGTAITVARLNTSDPLLISKRYGRGEVALFTSTLDADWNTLPAKPDFVPLLHELVFHLSAGRALFNVETGAPLVMAIPPDTKVDEYEFVGPDDTHFPAQPGGDELRPLARLNDTRLPGVYTFVGKQATDKDGQAFVVNFDRGESDLTALDESQRLSLQSGDRLKFIDRHEDLAVAFAGNQSKTEFWYVLLLVFLAVVIGEVLMTRRLVQGGHVDLESQH